MGMAAVFAAIILSKGNRSVPVVIFSYYAFYIAMDYSAFGFQSSAFDIVTVSKQDAVNWYLIQMVIDASVVVSLLTLCKQTKLVRLYAAIITLSAAYNVFGLLFSSLSMDWYSDIYLLHQRYAIQLDIIFAWLASDNFISQKINGALNGENTELEHGKPH